LPSGLNFADKSQLFDYYGRAIERSELPSLHCFIFSSDAESPIERAIERARDKGLITSLLSKNDQIYQVRIGIRTSSQIGFFVPVDKHWMFISEGESSRISQIMASFSRRMFPILNLVYVPSLPLLEMVERVKTKYDSVEVVEGTFCKTGETFRNWKKTPLEFNLKTMMGLARREEAKWTGVTLKFKADGDVVFGCRFSENGHLTLYSGNFLEFYSDAVLPYIYSSEQIRQKLDGRERKETDDSVILSPISIDFKAPISETEAHTIEKKIIDGYAAAVLHPGNPMLMIQLSDRDDGSSFDLYVFKKKVEIVPQQKSTPDSLGNLVSLVSDILPTGTALW